MSAGTRDELLSRIVDAMESVVARIARLERAQEDNAALALEVAELRVDHEMAQDEQGEVNSLLAGKLGGRLVKVTPPSRFPLLVIDNTQPPGNDNSVPPEGGP
jgi:hypothetical protein